jgi:hypothetical protein
MPTRKWMMDSVHEGGDITKVVIAHYGGYERLQCPFLLLGGQIPAGFIGALIYDLFFNWDTTE